MSRFDQRMSTSSGVLMWHNSDAVTYREPGCDPVELSAILGFEAVEEIDGASGRKLKLVRDVTICTDPAGPYGGVALPATNAWFEIDGVDYSIEEVMSRSGTFVRLAVKQSKAIERGRQGMRST